LRARLTTALDRNKQLADENARLRRQLARALGDQRSAGVRSGNDQEGLYSSDKAASVTSATLSTTGLRRSRPCLTRKLKIMTKANMPTLYRQLKKLPWTAVPAVSAVSTDHGRRARRTIKAALAPAWIGFAGAAQVAQLRRTVTRNGKKTVEVVYLITSDRDADPATLAAWARSHCPAGRPAPGRRRRAGSGRR
jgi:hypothetical protein